MESSYNAIKKKYGVLGWHDKNNVKILNTIDNIIRCSLCPHLHITEKVET